MNVFGEKLESACLSIRMSVCPSVYKLLLSVKALAGGLKSNSVTVLVYITKNSYLFLNGIFVICKCFQFQQVRKIKNKYHLQQWK